MEGIEFKHVPDPEPVQNRQQLVVKVETNCFLCLNNYNHPIQPNQDDNLPSSKNVEKVSLPRICRYLKADTSRILYESPKLILLLAGNNSCSSVNICSECKPVAENLSNLLEQLELLQTKVDYSLCQFRKLLKDSAENKNISENFRAEIITKCDQKLNAIPPHVTIPDVQGNPAWVTSEVIPSSVLPAHQAAPEILPVPTPNLKNKSNRWQCNHCPSNFKHQRTLHTHQRHLHGEIFDHTCPRCRSKFTKRSDYVQHKNFDCPRLPPGTSKNNPPRGHKKCTACNPPKIVLVNNWRRHNLRFHVETYFKDNREPNISPENFKIYCEHVFKMQQGTVKGKKSGNVFPRKCPHCTDNFINLELLRSHLMSFHKNVLTKLVIATQQKLTIDQVKNGANLPTISYTGNNVRPPGSNPSRKYEQIGTECKHCGLNVSTEANLRKHLRRIHKIEPKLVDSNEDGETVGNQNVKVEILEENLEQSDLLVTKLDVESFPQSGSNYAEMEIVKEEGYNCDEEFAVGHDHGNFDMEINSDKDPLEI